MPTNENEMILARLRGVPAQKISKLEAMMAPDNPQRYGDNDNEAPGHATATLRSLPEGTRRGALGKETDAPD